MRPASKADIAAAAPISTARRGVRLTRQPRLLHHRNERKRRDAKDHGQSQARHRRDTQAVVGKLHKTCSRTRPRMNNSFLKKVLRNQNSEMTAKPAQTKSVPGIPAGDSVSAGGLPCRYCA